MASPLSNASYRAPTGLWRLDRGCVAKVTSTVPIVFAVTADPVGASLVASMARPGGNATGFMAFEDSMSGKWPELLKQIAPAVTRASVLGDSTLPSGCSQLAAIQTAAPSFGKEVSPVDVRDSGEIERAITAFAGFPNGGLIASSTRGVVDSS